MISYPDFVSQTGNIIAIESDACVEAVEYQITFAYPSYYENSFFLLYLIENENRKVISPIIPSSYLILDTSVFDPISFEFSVIVGTDNQPSDCDVLEYSFTDDDGLSQYFYVDDS